MKPPPSPPPNPDSGSDGSGGDGSDGRLLLLLFLESGLLLLPLLKALNPLNRFAPTVLKCEKCPPPVFTLLVALF